MDKKLLSEIYRIKSLMTEDVDQNRVEDWYDSSTSQTIINRIFDDLPRVTTKLVNYRSGMHLVIIDELNKLYPSKLNPSDTNDVILKYMETVAEKLDYFKNHIKDSVDLDSLEESELEEILDSIFDSGVKYPDYIKIGIGYKHLTPPTTPTKEPMSDEDMDRIVKLLVKSGKTEDRIKDIIKSLGGGSSGMGGGELTSDGGVSIESLSKKKVVRLKLTLGIEKSGSIPGIKAGNNIDLTLIGRFSPKTYKYKPSVKNYWFLIDMPTELGSSSILFRDTETLTEGETYELFIKDSDDVERTEDPFTGKGEARGTIIDIK